MSEFDRELILSVAANLSHLSPNQSVGFNYDLLFEEYYRNLQNHDADQHRRNMITYYLMGIGGMVVCCLGLIGNVLSLLVLTQRTMRLSTNSYLAALSVCDSIVLIFTMILLSKDVDRPIEGESRWKIDEGIYPHIFPYIHPLAFTFQVTSIWLTLAFTVDRYIMICHPFKAEPFCTISRARKVIIVLYFAAIVFNIPKFFEYETVAIPLPMQNASKIGYDLTSFGRSHIFRQMYHSWFYVAFVCGIPFVTLAVLNSFLMHAVRLSRKRGREINVADKKRNDTTIMLIGVVVVFFICQMPALVSRTIWAFEHDPQAFQRLPLYTLNEIGNFLIILNSAINIVPYYFFGRKFRKEFWRLFCHCLLRYSRFQTLSRSFSLTILDQSRRPSQASHMNNATYCDDVKHKLSCCNTTIPLIETKPQQKQGNNTLLPVDVRHNSTDSCGQHSISSWMTDDSNNRRLMSEQSEVNGNCLSGGENSEGGGVGGGPRKCLLYNSVKPDQVSYGDEEL